jgi:hypothetical protein
MDEQKCINELRKLLFKELSGELNYNEKKEFLQECIDRKVILKLHEKYLKRRKLVILLVVLYSIYLGIILGICLVSSASAALTFLITIALILLPFLVWVYFTRLIMGYEKTDLVLRIMTKFYVKKEL